MGAFAFLLSCALRGLRYGDSMSRPRVALVILGDAMPFIVVFVLFQIDQFVNGTLYGYGLEFSNDWAQPYGCC